MAERRLGHCRVLIVEDEYLLADELSTELQEEGAVVLGPVANVESALVLLANDLPPDGAVLDVNLGGEPAYALADALIQRGVPFVFTPGYDRCALPERFSQVPTCEKPLDLRSVTTALRKAIDG